MTLAKELAKLNEPAPRSIDPESFDAVDSLDAAATREHTTGSAAEVLRPAPGKGLRGIHLEEPKYRGRVVRREDLVDRGDPAVDSSDDEVSSMRSDVDSGEDAGEEESGSAVEVRVRDKARVESAFSPSRRKAGDDEGEKDEVSVVDDEVEDDDDDEEGEDGVSDEGEPEVLRKQSEGYETSPEKTKIQLKQWGDAVGVRIRLQPLLIQAMNLPVSSSSPKISSMLATATATLQSCLNELVAIRSKAVSHSTPYFHEKHKRNLKRSRSAARLDADENLTKRWESLAEENTILKNYYEEVFDRWHERSVHALGISGKRLQALNQPISHQVDQVLKSGKEVIRRSQMRESKHDPEVYNDADFYQQLLKEYISTAGHSSSEPTVKEAMKGGKRLKRTKKKGVDVKASKGRKIRYTVHDKLVNFVAPNPQPPSRLNVDQLMTSLFAS